MQFKLTGGATVDHAFFHRNGCFCDLDIALDRSEPAVGSGRRQGLERRITLGLYGLEKSEGLWFQPIGPFIILLHRLPLMLNYHALCRCILLVQQYTNRQALSVCSGVHLARALVCIGVHNKAVKQSGSRPVGRLAKEKVLAYSRIACYT